MEEGGIKIRIVVIKVTNIVERLLFVRDFFKCYEMSICNILIINEVMKILEGGF